MSIAAVIATVMQVDAHDPRLPIVIDVVRSMDALHRSQDKARAGRIGAEAKAKQNASRTPAERQQNASKVAAQPPTPHLISTDNHSCNIAQQAIASPEREGLGGFLTPVPSVSPSGPGPILSQPPISEDRQSDEPPRRATPAYSDAFEAFWAAYPQPRRVGKGAAWGEWKRLAPPLNGVLAALAWQCVSEAWQDPRFIPHPERYLKKRRWEDSRPVAMASTPPMSDRERGNRQALSAFVAKGGKLL